MWGGAASFNNPLGESILSNFIVSNKDGSGKQGSYRMTDAEQKNILATVKQNKDLDKETNLNPSGKPTVVKTTVSLAQNNNIKKRIEEVTRPDDKKSFEQFEDILNEALGQPSSATMKTEDKSQNRAFQTDTTPPVSATRKLDEGIVNEKSALEALSENSVEDVFSGYDPTVRSSNSRRPTPVKDRRPHTTETKAPEFSEEFGEIDMRHSRRKPRGQTDRPVSSPGFTTKSDPNAEANSKSGSKMIKTFVDETSPEFKPKPEEKKTSPKKNPPILKLETFNEAGNTITPVRSPESNLMNFSKNSTPVEAGPTKIPSTFREQPEGTSARDSIEREFNKAPLAGTNVQKSNLPKVELSRIETPLNQNLPNLTTMLTPNMEKQLQFMFPNPGDAFMKNYLKESEEMYKKRVKDLEEYYEQRHQAQKNALEQERKQMEEYLKRESELMKKERDDYKESMAEIIEQERQRMKELFKIEMESKEKVHKYEMERQKQVYEEQYKNLKHQFESQAKLNHLADEIRMSSTKIMVLSDKLETGKLIDDRGKDFQAMEKEKEIKERESWLQHEKQMLNGEKLRLEKAKKQVDEKEAEIEKNLEKERGWIKSEYARLSNLQESLNKFEEMKRKEIEKERKAFEGERAQFEKDKIELLRQLKEKDHESEHKMALFETKRREVEEILQKAEKEVREKQEEIEELRRILIMQQQEMDRKMMEIEEKERETQWKASQIQEKLDLITREAKYLEIEKHQVSQLHQQARDNTEMVHRIQREKDLEDEKYKAIKFELDQYAESIRKKEHSLDRERQDLMMSQKVLQESRSTHAKDFMQTMVHARKPTMDPFSNIAKTERNTLVAPSSHRRIESAHAITFRPSSTRTTNLTSFVPSTTMSRNGSMAGLHSHRASMDLQGDSTPMAHGVDLSSKRSSMAEIQGTMRKSVLTHFDLDNYMNELKQIEKEHEDNTNFLLSQDDALLKERMALEGEKLSLMMSIRSDISTLPSSRLKTSK